MKNILKKITFLLLFGSATVVAQNNNSQLNNIPAFSPSNFNLKEIKEERSTDSIRKSELEAMLFSVKASETEKKKELQSQLIQLKKEIQAKKVSFDSIRLKVKSYPVYGFFNDTLFLIYSKLGSFSPQDRADAIGKRIKNIADVYSFKKDSLKISDAETTVDVLFGETIIVSVSENDAIWNATSKHELAKKYKAIIGEAVVRYQSEISDTTLAKEIGLALFALLVVGFLIFCLIKLFKGIAAKISYHEGKLINEIKIKNYTLLNTKRQINALLALSKILKWVIILFIIYLALPILFGIFPWTEHFSETLFGYIVTPSKKIILSVWNYLPNLITIIVIVIVFRYVLKGIHFFKTEIEKGNLHLSGFYPDWANPTFQILKVAVYAFMVIVVFPYLPGSNSPVFQGVSVFLGVLFTFGSSGSLSNVVAGLVLTYMRLFKIGDRVKIGDVVGDIIEKSLLVTRIRTIKNEIISIPNATVMNSHTINYSSDTNANGLILHTTVTIGYDVPWKDMHLALINAANRTNFILKEPKPFVLQTSLDDFYVSYQINAYTKEANKQASIYSDLHANIQDCCNEVGIEILSPHYRSARDGNATTIPTDYLEKDYKAPSFNLNIKTEDK